MCAKAFVSQLNAVYHLQTQKNAYILVYCTRFKKGTLITSGSIQLLNSYNVLKNIRLFALNSNVSEILS